MLLAFAKKLNHPVQAILEGTFNYFYTQDVEELEHELDKDLARISAGNFRTKQIHLQHFSIMKNAVPDLKGIAVFDSDGKGKKDSVEKQKDFALVHWKKYELENYFVTPSIVLNYIQFHVKDSNIISIYEEVWNAFLLENLFNNRTAAYESYLKLDKPLQEFQFEQLLANKKASLFLEQFLEKLALQTQTPVLLRKGSFYKLIDFMEIDNIDSEISEKLDLIQKYLQ